MSLNNDHPVEIAETSSVKLNDTTIRDNIRIGIHTPYSNNMLHTIYNGTSSLVKCCQFFLSASRNFSVKVATDNDIELCREFCKTNSFTFFIHAPLVVNLANMKALGYTAITKILNSIKGLPGAMVIHTGSVGTTCDTIDAINKFDLHEYTHPLMSHQFLLENSAGQGTSIGKTWEELHYILSHVNTQRVGLCIDTQHIFASGMCDLSNIEGVKCMFSIIDTHFNSLLKVIHLNDSKVPFASKVDRHENIGYGYIWYNNYDPLRLLLKECVSRNINIILETPDRMADINNIFMTDNLFH